ncbi:MAG: hypothetical protein JW867_00295 [Candidatus Omnitrophica bacterium]|nr:hypothetical protein [Candidatus Omnitrophota bacterium]
MNYKQKTVISIVALIVSAAAFISYTPKQKASIRGMKDALNSQQAGGDSADFNWNKMLLISVPALVIGLVLLDVLKDKDKEEWERYLKQ